jgi:uncharacterized protein YqeY
MELSDRVNKDIAGAMRARNQARLAPLRMLKTALVNRGIEKGRDLDAAEERQVVASLVKQRRDSIEQFRAGGRQDLADREAAEITVLESYLPPAPDAADLERAVEAAIFEAGATSPQDLGKVMKVVMARLAGLTVDGRTVNEIARRKLSTGR